ncbi:MAG: hypothetical protein HY700_06670 [Gemmatimonadetes bacterium]|nr:hypothetical protein [Gemmatimonadota bacterium]
MTPPKDQPRDWDKELAKVDRLIAAGGEPAAAPARVPAPTVAGPRPRETFFTWIRLSLALIVGIGMTQWPYLHGCGLPLFAYLGGVVTVIVASLWSMISSWRSRSATAHFLSVALLLWGSALGLREVLPRVGYARQSANWFCAQPGEKTVTPP